MMFKSFPVFCSYRPYSNKWPYKNYAHVSVSVGQIKSLKLESLDYKGWVFLIFVKIIHVQMSRILQFYRVCLKTMKKSSP